jgi:hypothetical protein
MPDPSRNADVPHVGIRHRNGPPVSVLRQAAPVPWMNRQENRDAWPSANHFLRPLRRNLGVCSEAFRHWNAQPLVALRPGKDYHVPSRNGLVFWHRGEQIQANPDAELLVHR